MSEHQNTENKGRGYVAELEQSRPGHAEQRDAVKSGLCLGSQLSTSHPNPLPKHTRQFWRPQRAEAASAPAGPVTVPRPSFKAVPDIGFRGLGALQSQESFVSCWKGQASDIADPGDRGCAWQEDPSPACSGKIPAQN